MFLCKHGLCWKGSQGIAPGSLGDPRSSAHYWPSLLLEGMGPPWELHRINLLLCRQLSLHRIELGGVLSLHRCKVREDPAPAGVDHTGLTEVGNSQVLLGRLARLRWPVPPSRPTPTPTPEDRIMGQ